MVRTARVLRRVKNVYTVDRRKRRRLLEIQAASYDIGNWCPENARKSLVMAPKKEIDKKIKIFEGTRAKTNKLLHDLQGVLERARRTGELEKVQPMW